jgi:hypothetical protein
MPRDYEDAINLDQLSDEDVRDLVVQRLGEAEGFDADAVEVEVDAGRVRVEGRVGTDGERQHVEQVLSAVDRLARQERDEAADMARLEDAAAPAPLGETGAATSDTAEHLRRDDQSELYGTGDMRKAIEEGRSYEPPEGPFQEGVGGGERH